VAGILNDKFTRERRSFLVTRRLNTVDCLKQLKMES
jgi:hypothetical protein